MKMTTALVEFSFDAAAAITAAQLDIFFFCGIINALR